MTSEQIMRYKNGRVAQDGDYVVAPIPGYWGSGSGVSMIAGRVTNLDEATFTCRLVVPTEEYERLAFVIFQTLRNECHPFVLTGQKVGEMVHVEDAMDLVRKYPQAIRYPA